MPTTDETQAILDVITILEEAANEADPTKAEAVLLLEDVRFSEIEDFVPEPFGAEGVIRIHDWIRQNGRPGDNVRFTGIKVYLLSPEVAYATAIQELHFDEPGKSRVTFVFLKQDGDWGIIHAHYSTMPSG
ncbi:MAG: nuclear transport factor 2 family protein [Anaerolineae bacterium]|nr:nuclear transport factor 2 family protein [Anaerolineae bacterium]